MLMRRIHLVLGLTFGTILAISGLTGATLSFDEEILNALDNKQCNGQATIVDLERTLLSAETQLGTGKLLSARVDADCELEVQDVAHQTYYLRDSEQLIKQSSSVPLFKSFFHSIKEIHEGHWFAPSNPLSLPIWKSFGISAFMLFFIVPIGLYMRWPKHGKHSLKYWFSINTALKGAALLRRSHLVLGAIFATTLLISAHTGAFQAVSTSWYASTIKTLFGDDTQKPKFRPPPPPKDNISLVKVADLTELLAMLEKQNYDSAAIEFELPAKIMFKGKNSSGMIALNEQTSTVDVRAFGETSDNQHWLSATNQDLHEGKLFGLPGRIVMTLSALSLPFFYISGIVFFIKRHRRKKI